MADCRNIGDRAVLLALAVTTLTACGREVYSPTRPTAERPPFSVTLPLPPPPTPGPSDASLSFSDVKFVDDGGGVYAPSFTLTETTGASDAVLMDMSLEYGSIRSYLANDQPDGRGCFIRSSDKRVPAGAAWKSTSIYPYCLDYVAWKALEGGSVIITVRYRDEAGHIGEAMVAAPAVR